MHAQHALLIVSVRWHSYRKKIYFYPIIISLDDIIHCNVVRSTWMIFMLKREGVIYSVSRVWKKKFFSFFSNFTSIMPFIMVECIYGSNIKYLRHIFWYLDKNLWVLHENEVCCQRKMIMQQVTTFSTP